MKAALVATTTSTTSAPSAATDGIALRGPKATRVNGQGPDFGENDVAMVVVTSTAGSGVMTCQVHLWGYHADAGVWFRFLPLNMSAAGVAQDIGETSNDSINYGELVYGLRQCDRIAAQVTAIAGTSTSVKVDLVGRGVKP